MVNFGFFNRFSSVTNHIIAKQEKGEEEEEETN
jgi:hypothetical protein